MRPGALALLVGGGLAALVGLAALPVPWPWWLQLLDHFPQQAGLVVGATAVVAALSSARRSARVLGALALVLLARWGAVPRGPVEAPAAGSGEPRLRLVVANVLTSNPEREALLAVIAAEAPDLVGLLEVDAAWLSGLDALRERYPHALEVPRPDNFGVALYSRVALRSLEAGELPGGLPTARAVLPGGTTLELVHTVPPAGAAASALQARQLAELGARLGGGPFVVAGDLNVTPWSGRFPQPGAAIAGGTWPARWPGPLRLPLDHVLGGGGARVVAIRTLPAVGSDHLPIAAEIALPRP